MVAHNAFDDKLSEVRAHQKVKNRRRNETVTRFVIWGATDLVALGALTLGAWSTQVVAHWLGFPGFTGWVFSGVLDGSWITSLAVVQRYRHEPWRALGAYRAVTFMVVLSALVNFGHGMIRFGVTDHGAIAGIAFALLPVALKWLVAISTHNSMGVLMRAPDAKDRLRQAGQVVAELELNRVLEPLANRVNQQTNYLVQTQNRIPELSSPVPALTVQDSRVYLERVQSEADETWIPGWVNEKPQVSPVQAHPELGSASVNEVPEVEPVEVPEFKTRQERVNHLAQEIGRRGGQLGSLTLNEVADLYGIERTKKSTLSGLRKDAHKTWLIMAPTGQYL